MKKRQMNPPESSVKNMLQKTHRISHIPMKVSRLRNDSTLTSINQLRIEFAMASQLEQPANRDRLIY